MSPATFNAASIVVVVALVPFAPQLGVAPIVIVAMGTLVGGLAQVAIQWPALAREGFRYRPHIDVRDEGLRRVLLLMGPGTIGLAATQINVFVNTILATGQGTGAVSWLDYAFRLMYLPIGLFGVSVATASTPAVSRLVASREFDRVRATIAHAIGLMMLLNVPATVGLIVLAEPIVRVIFEHGSFTATDTANTASALRFYAAGLLGYSVVRIVSPTFYALGQSRTPVMVSMASVLVNVMLNLALVRVLGYRGLALGTSITALLNASAQLWLLRRRLSGINGRAIAVSFVRVLLASLVMAVMAWGADRMLLQWLPGDTLPMQALRLALVIALSVGALAAAAAALGIPELAERAAVEEALAGPRAHRGRAGQRALVLGEAGEAGTDGEVGGDDVRRRGEGEFVDLAVEERAAVLRVDRHGAVAALDRGDRDDRRDVVDHPAALVLQARGVEPSVFHHPDLAVDVVDGVERAVDAVDLLGDLGVGLAAQRHDLVGDAVQRVGEPRGRADGVGEFRARLRRGRRRHQRRLQPGRERGQGVVGAGLAHRRHHPVVGVRADLGRPDRGVRGPSATRSGTGSRRASSR